MTGGQRLEWADKALTKAVVPMPVPAESGHQACSLNMQFPQVHSEYLGTKGGALEFEKHLKTHA